MAVLANKNRLTLVAAVSAVILFIFALLHQNSEHSEIITSAFSSVTYATSKVWPLKPEKTFYEVAKEQGTDKVSNHSYHEMYEKYLPALRHKPIKMLEIGLGCDMTYGPGASYYTWLGYFANVDLYYMEYDAECARQWSHEISGATVAAGDQGDPAVLEQFQAEYGGDFDIIIDDGGHTMNQQKTSLQHLWKALKPGGYYFCEDLETSFREDYGGGVSGKPGTMIDFIRLLMEDMMYPVYGDEEALAAPRQIVFEDVESMVHIDCSRQICMFEKRRE